MVSETAEKMNRVVTVSILYKFAYIYVYMAVRVCVCGVEVGEYSWRVNRDRSRGIRGWWSRWKGKERDKKMLYRVDENMTISYENKQEK